MLVVNHALCRGGPLGLKGILHDENKGLSFQKESTNVPPGNIADNFLGFINIPKPTKVLTTDNPNYI